MEVTSSHMVLNSRETNTNIFRENADVKSNRPRTETLKKDNIWILEKPKKKLRSIAFISSFFPDSSLIRQKHFALMNKYTGQGFSSVA